MLLPAELTDHIFSFLRGDASALSAISRAHSFYLRLAERHLYADIIVRTRNPLAVSELYKKLSDNSHILDYACTLEIRSGFPFPPFAPSPEALSIVSMIPRMANLKSLKLCDLTCIDLGEHFHSTLRNCLQQSFIEELYLYFLYDFPLSVLDNNNNIKKLMLFDCTAMEESISSSVSPHQSLETLIICGDHNPGLLFWTMGRISRLTSLELRYGLVDQEWTAFPELLTACSKLLRRLHLDVGYHCQSTYIFPTNHHVGGWISDDLEFPFTLSALLCLKELSVSAILYLGPRENQFWCALPAIMRLIKTAPSIQVLVLSFFCEVPDVTSLARLDWSPLDRLRSGIRPHINLRIGGKAMGGPFSAESILNALAGNEALMNLVNQDVVVLKPEVMLPEKCGGFTESF